MGAAGTPAVSTRSSSPRPLQEERPSEIHPRRTLNSTRSRRRCLDIPGHLAVRALDRSGPESTQAGVEGQSPACTRQPPILESQAPLLVGSVHSDPAAPQTRSPWPSRTAYATMGASTPPATTRSGYRTHLTGDALPRPARGPGLLCLVGMAPSLLVPPGRQPDLLPAQLPPQPAGRDQRKPRPVQLLRTSRYGPPRARAERGAPPSPLPRPLREQRPLRTSPRGHGDPGPPAPPRHLHRY